MFLNFRILTFPLKKIKSNIPLKPISEIKTLNYAEKTFCFSSSTPEYLLQIFKYGIMAPLQLKDPKTSEMVNFGKLCLKALTKHFYESMTEAKRFLLL